jgi:hypothetical protein
LNTDVENLMFYYTNNYQSNILLTLKPLKMKTIKLSLLLMFVLSLTGLKAQECRNMALTSNTYSETVNFQNVIRHDLGGNYAMADWNDLKAIPNIDAWISCMQLHREQSFMVTRNGNPVFSGKRQYNVQYFPSGRVPAGFLIHDKIGNKLFLGSWYGLNTNILAVKTGPRRDEAVRNDVRRDEVRRDEVSEFGGLKLTMNSYSERENLDQIVRDEFHGKCSIADWNDLKAIPNIDRWIAKMDLHRGQTFFVTRNGKSIFILKRQYFVLYSPSGHLPSGFITIDRINNQLFLGSQIGERRPILVRDFRNH